MSLVPVPSDQPGATCANCGAALVADQRYCLSCGQPVSPVRLAFLDALTPGTPTAAAPPQTAWGAPATIEVGPAGYLPPAPEQGLNAWLRRNSGLMGLLTVLILCLGIGLLLGHWVSQSKSTPPGSSTIKIEGLAGLAGTGAAGSSTTPSSTGSTPATTTKSSSSQEAKEAEEGEHETAAEKAPPKKATKVAPTTIKKLTESKGKKHQEEINALGNKPIETG
jgi:hypothetical protein